MKKLLFLISLWAIVSSVQVMAQAQLAYGDTLTSRLSDTSPTSVYTLSGNADDTIHIHLMSLSDDFVPVVELKRGITPISSDDSEVNGATIRYDFTLPETGTYLLLVANEDRQTGEFALHVSADTPILLVV